MPRNLILAIGVIFIIHVVVVVAVVDTIVVVVEIRRGARRGESVHRISRRFDDYAEIFDHFSAGQVLFQRE